MKNPFKGAAKRNFYYAKTLKDVKPQRDEYGTIIRAAADPVKEAEANLIGSLTDKGTHMPHYHLYLNKEISWNHYAAILDAFRDAGLIENGWYETAVASESSFVRKPGLYKTVHDPELDGATKAWAEKLGA